MWMYHKVHNGLAREMVYISIWMYHKVLYLDVDVFCSLLSLPLWQGGWSQSRGVHRRGRDPPRSGHKYILTVEGEKERASPHITLRHPTLDIAQVC